MLCNILSTFFIITLEWQTYFSLLTVELSPGSLISVILVAMKLIGECRPIILLFLTFLSSMTIAIGYYDFADVGIRIVDL